MRVADAVEDQQRLTVLRPFPGCVRDKIDDRPRAGNGDDTAVEDRTGDAREFRLVDLTIGLPLTGEHLAERPDLALHPVLEEQPFYSAGIALEQSPHGGKSADPQQLPLVGRTIVARLAKSGGLSSLHYVRHDGAFGFRTSGERAQSNTARFDHGKMAYPILPGGDQVRQALPNIARLWHRYPKQDNAARGRQP